MAYKFVGAVKLSAYKGYIEVVRADAVRNGFEFDAEADVIALAKTAVAHAERLNLMIKAFVPNVEPTKKGEKGENLFSPAAIKKLALEPVVLKSRLPLPYLAFLDGKKTGGKDKPEGLGMWTGNPPVKAKKAEPEGL